MAGEFLSKIFNRKTKPVDNTSVASTPTDPVDYSQELPANSTNTLNRITLSRRRFIHAMVGVPVVGGFAAVGSRLNLSPNSAVAAPEAQSPLEPGGIVDGILPQAQNPHELLNPHLDRSRSVAGAESLQAVAEDEPRVSLVRAEYYSQGELVLLAPYNPDGTFQISPEQENHRVELERRILSGEVVLKIYTKDLLLNVEHPHPIEFSTYTLQDPSILHAERNSLRPSVFGENRANDHLISILKIRSNSAKPQPAGEQPPHRKTGFEFHALVQAPPEVPDNWFAVNFSATRAITQEEIYVPPTAPEQPSSAVVKRIYPDFHQIARNSQQQFFAPMNVLAEHNLLPTAEPTKYSLLRQDLDRFIVASCPGVGVSSFNLCYETGMSEFLKLVNKHLVSRRGVLQNNFNAQAIRDTLQNIRMDPDRYGGWELFRYGEYKADINMIMDDINAIVQSIPIDRPDLSEEKRNDMRFMQFFDLLVKAVKEPWNSQLSLPGGPQGQRTDPTWMDVGPGFFDWMRSTILHESAHSLLSKFDYDGATVEADASHFEIVKVLDLLQIQVPLVFNKISEKLNWGPTEPIAKITAFFNFQLMPDVFADVEQLLQEQGANQELGALRDLVKKREYIKTNLDFNTKDVVSLATHTLGGTYHLRILLDYLGAHFAAQAPNFQWKDLYTKIAQAMSWIESHRPKPSGENDQPSIDASEIFLKVQEFIGVLPEKQLNFTQLTTEFVLSMATNKYPQPANQVHGEYLNYTWTKLKERFDDPEMIERVTDKQTFLSPVGLPPIPENSKGRNETDLSWKFVTLQFPAEIDPTKLIQLGTVSGLGEAFSYYLIHPTTNERILLTPSPDGVDFTAEITSIHNSENLGGKTVTIAMINDSSKTNYFKPLDTNFYAAGVDKANQQVKYVEFYFDITDNPLATATPTMTPTATATVAPPTVTPTATSTEVPAVVTPDPNAGTPTPGPEGDQEHDVFMPIINRAEKTE